MIRSHARRASWHVGAPALALMVALLGCSEPITGRWKQVNAEPPRNSMTVGSDGTGMAELVYLLTQTGDAIQNDLFEFDWDNDGDDAYLLSMVCIESSAGEFQPDCSDHDFTMSCAMDGSSEMSCEGDHAWEDYTLEWERDGSSDDDSPDDDGSE